MKSLRHNAVLLLVAMTALSGCKTMEFGGTNWINQTERPRLMVDMPFKSLGKKTFAAPEKMTVIWKESTLASTGKPTVRGFGGRVFFYDAENNPVKVDGEMVVYGFDTEAGSTQADKKFVFTADRLEDHYGETDLGHSYSFWVPWDQIGGDQKSITLIPAFKTAEGKVVKGGLSVNMLPGKTPPEKELKATSYTGKEIELTSGNGKDGKVIRAGHTDGGKPRIRETTIRLPKHLGNRISSIPNMPINEIQVTQKVIQVLENQDEKVAGEVEQTRRSGKALFEEAHQKTKDRAPFGKPESFN